MGYWTCGLGSHLPAVPHISDAGTGRKQIQGRYCRSHIPHIRGSRLKLYLARIVVVYLRIQGMLPYLLKSVLSVQLCDLVSDICLGLIAIAFHKILCQPVVCLIPGRSSHLGDALISHRCQGIVGYVFCKCHGKLTFIAGAGHDGSPSGHFLYPLKYLLCLSHIWSPYLISYYRTVLDHIGGSSARVYICIVYPCLRYDMLSEIIAAHAHELTGIQGAAPQIGSGACMG